MTETPETAAQSVDRHPHLTTIESIKEERLKFYPDHIPSWLFEKIISIADTHAKEKAELERRLAEAEANLEAMESLNESHVPTLKEVHSQLLSAQQDNRRLREALKDLIYTATKLWDYAKPMKDSYAISVTHPTIEAASEAVSAPENNQLIAEVVEVLWFYADPGTYHGMAAMFDPPTGGFDEDWSDDHGDPDYSYAKPGKKARAVLRKLGKDST